jgi:uncharacterized membrane protein YfcA
VTPALDVLLLIVFFLAAIVNGVVGLGFGLIAAAFVAIIADARLAVLLLGLVAPVSSFQQMYLHRQFASVLRRMVLLLAGALVGVLLGSWLLSFLPVSILTLAFGIFTIWHVAMEFRRGAPVVFSRLDQPAAALVGTVAGITAGAVGASGPILGAFLQRAGLAPREFVFAIGSVFFAMGVLRLGTLIALGEYDSPTLLLAAVLVIPALIGQRFGFRLQGRLDREAFRRLVLIVLLCAGVGLIIRGIWGLLHP